MKAIAMTKHSISYLELGNLFFFVGSKNSSLNNKEKFVWCQEKPHCTKESHFLMMDFQNPKKKEPLINLCFMKIRTSCKIQQWNHALFDACFYFFFSECRKFQFCHDSRMKKMNSFLFLMEEEDELILKRLSGS